MSEKQETVSGGLILHSVLWGRGFAGAQGVWAAGSGIPLPWNE